MSDDLGRALAGRRVLATPLLREPNTAHPTARPEVTPRLSCRQRPAPPAVDRALLTLLSVAAVAGGLLLAHDSGSTPKRGGRAACRGADASAARRMSSDAGRPWAGETADASTENVDTVLSSDPAVRHPARQEHRGQPGLQLRARFCEDSPSIIGMTRQQAASRPCSGRPEIDRRLVVTPGKTVGTVSGTPPVNSTILTTLAGNGAARGPPDHGRVRGGQPQRGSRRESADAPICRCTVLEAGPTVPDGQVLSQSSGNPAESRNRHHHRHQQEGGPHTVTQAHQDEGAKAGSVKDRRPDQIQRLSPGGRGPRSG